MKKRFVPETRMKEVKLVTEWRRVKICQRE